MPEHHKVSLLLVGNQHRRLGMPQKYRLLSLIVICFTLLFFTWMIRDSLCELHIKQESYELAAFLACCVDFQRVCTAPILLDDEME